MNRAELRAEIARNGITNRYISRELKISEQAFHNKINGISEFKESEIRKISAVLNLTPEKMQKIFFAENSE